MPIREGAENGDAGQESLRLEMPENDDPETKVRLDEPDDDTEDSDEGDKPEQKAADGQPRKKDGKWAEKKAERGKSHREAKAWEKEKVEYDRRLARQQEDYDRRFKQLTDEFDRFRQNARGDQRPNDPFAGKLGEIEAQIEQELALIENDANRGYKHYNQLRRQEQTLITQQAIAQSQAAQQAQQAQRPQDPYQHRRPVIAMEFPWTDDPRYDELTRKGRAYRDYLIHHEGRPDTIDTDREALTQTIARFGAEFGLRPPPAAPSQRTRGLWQAPASRAAPDRRPVPREVDLGEVGRGTGLSNKSLAAAVAEALRDEN